MSKYRKLPVEVEAFRITGAPLVYGNNWPGWVAVSSGVPRIGEVSFSPGVVTHDFSMMSPHGPIRCHFGDWIVLDQFGHLWPYTDEDFHLVFEEVV